MVTRRMVREHKDQLKGVLKATTAELASAQNRAESVRRENQKTLRAILPGFGQRELRNKKGLAPSYLKTVNAR